MERENEVQISVVMSVYNEPESWVNASIESILNQSFRDFEFIIINDNPARILNRDILEKYSKIDSRVIFIENEDNIGLTKSLNKGIKIARGKYIARMDADDLSVINRLIIQYDFLESNPNYIACGSSVLMLKDSKLSHRIYKKPLKNEDIRAQLFFESPIIHPTLFFKNGYSFLLYNEKYKYSQDFDFISTLSKNGKLHNFNQPLLKYRQSSSQITNKNINEQNNYAYTIRKINIANYLRKIYYLDLIELLEKKPEEIISIFTNFMKHNSDRKNLSSILYSILFYFDPKKRTSFQAKLLLQCKIRLKSKYRIRLLLSNWITFRDQHKFQ